MGGWWGRKRKVGGGKVFSGEREVGTGDALLASHDAACEVAARGRSRKKEAGVGRDSGGAGRRWRRGWDDALAARG